VPGAAEKLAEELRRIGWHIDTTQMRCPDPDCSHSSLHEPHKSYCPYCGTELEESEGGKSDLKKALRRSGLVGRGPEEDGVIEIEIPVLIDPEGRVNAQYMRTEDGEASVQESLLEDLWYDKEDVPRQKVYIRARIDLEALFEGRTTDGIVTTDPDR
jgi:ribosomal protein S27E